MIDVKGKLKHKEYKIKNKPSLYGLCIQTRKENNQI